MTTFSGQVSLSSDDSDQLFGATPTNSLTDPSITLGLAAARRRWAGFRFQNVTIPPGATIVSAILSIFVPSGGNVNMAATILGNLTANPSTFAATSNYLASLADTSHTVSWSATLTLARVPAVEGYRPRRQPASFDFLRGLLSPRSCSDAT